jgi:nitroreductase
MDVFEAIRNRRSIRRYTGEPVEPGLLEKVLEAARLAPSANNRQEWRFVVVTDPLTRQKLSIAADGQAFVAEAPVVIVCCAVGAERVMRCGHPAYALDLGIAVEHMALAAAALGLGTCWIGAFDPGRVREMLGIPESVAVVEMLTLGAPAESPAARPRKPLDEVACRGKWGFESA